MSSSASAPSAGPTPPGPTAITRIAVAGAGFMGGGIAAEFALRVAQLESVVLWDAADGAAARAVERAQDVVTALQSAGVLTAAGAAARLPRLRAAKTLEEALEGAEYVAEVVPEDLSLKQQVFKRLDAVSAPTAILASNTSGYDPADLALGLSHPERVVVAHYFGPAYLIPAVEVVPHVATAGWAIEETEALLRAAGKRPIRLGKCVPGFIANRLQQALFREALWLMREGVATAEALDEIVRFSFGPRLAALGPMTVADFAGLDVYESLALNVWPTLSTEPCTDTAPPEIVERLHAKRLGVKSGGGIYEWPEARQLEMTARRDGALAAALRSDALLVPAMLRPLPDRLALQPHPRARPMQVRRLPINPIIRPHMDASMGDNINGPSLVRAPSWVENRLGTYYLYFGHHNGKYIRLAYADDLQGEWRTHEAGVLPLANTHFISHIASPDVLVDEARREVRLYFHGKLTDADYQEAETRGHDAPQGSRVAVSSDGLHFEVLPEAIGVPYFRVFAWDGATYAIGMPGVVYRSADGLTGFERGHNPFSHICEDMRHCAVLRRGHILHFFYTMRGDCPEHILATTLDLRRPWTEWHATDPVSVLKPELPWEGANEPLVPSDPGVVRVPVNQLRDPGIFEEDGHTYLLYSVAGEQGIAIAELLDV